ncbi:MAG: ORF6N domain-containing protein [Cytophagales bacterium]|nr:ORF6N domain-containing protein [Cytophagales bacterium]
MSKQIIPEEVVISKIYEIRGVKVMLDRDLAELYDVKSIRLREQVKRNIQKFPEHFMFQLTREETDNMVSQNAIPSKQHLGGSLPYVFTEHGILQLANVLKSGRAIQMSIKIIEVFIKMREMLLTHKDLLIEMENIRKKVAGQDKKIQMIFDYLKQFIKEKDEPKKEIGFKQKKK